MNDESEWTISTLKEHFEAKFVDRDTAIRVAVAELERRLHDLNNSHAAAREKEASFCSRESHDTFVSLVDRDFSRLRDEIKEMNKPQWAVWISAVALMLAITAGAWQLSIRPLQNDLDRANKILLQHERTTEDLLEKK
jgi:anti-sigma-K factor RskA